MAATERREMVSEVSTYKPVKKAPFSKRHPIISRFGKSIAAGIFLLGVSCAQSTNSLPRPSTPVVPAAASPAPVEFYDYARIYQIAERIGVLVPVEYDLGDPRIFDVGLFPNIGEEVHGLYRELYAHFADMEALIAGGTLTAEEAKFLRDTKNKVSAALAEPMPLPRMPEPSAVITCTVVPPTGPDSDQVVVKCPYIPEVPDSALAAVPVFNTLWVPIPPATSSIPNGRSTFGFGFGAQLNAPSVESQDGSSAPRLHTIGVDIMFDISNIFLE
ncbi:MAG: hypothetical protein WC350_00045 [Candidatus Micrarchaeia archaeon]|jgi:hypothetical protein